MLADSTVTTVTDTTVLDTTATTDLAGEEGFEPSHAGIKIQCLNQLGDSPTQVGNQSCPPLNRAGGPTRQGMSLQAAT